METQDTHKASRSYSVLIRVISGFLFFGVAMSGLILFSPTAVALGFFYQVCLVVASAITAAAAYGLWKHRKWGAWLYIGLTTINQPFLYFMGWWVAGALIIPGITILLILTKLRWLK